MTFPQRTGETGAAPCIGAREFPLAVNAMSYNIEHIKCRRLNSGQFPAIAAMSRGPSGRIVVEIEPQLKRGLYAELARNGLTLKDWLVIQAQRFIAESTQPSLFATSTPDVPERRSPTQ